MSITIKEETITPEQARAIMAYGYENRTLNQRKVIEYAVAIDQGKWSPTASKIEIDDKGKLLNGFHRLSACILANKPLTILVHRGVPTSDRDVIDTGEKRKLPDLYKMYTNKKFVNNQAAFLNQCLNLVTNDGSRRPRIQTLDVAKKWESIFGDGIEYFIEALMTPQGNKGWVGTMRNAYVGGAFAFALKRNPGKVKEFFKQVLHGENISQKDPAYTVRAMLLNMGNKETRMLTKRRDAPYKILSGIYCFIKEQPYSKAQISNEALDYFREAYDTAQVKNLLDPFIQMTTGKELAAKALADKVKAEHKGAKKSA